MNGREVTAERVRFRVTLGTLLGIFFGLTLGYLIDRDNRDPKSIALTLAFLAFVGGAVGASVGYLSAVCVFRPSRENFAALLSPGDLTSPGSTGSSVRRRGITSPPDPARGF